MTPGPVGGGLTTRWVVEGRTLLVSRCSMSPTFTTSILIKCIGLDKAVHIYCNDRYNNVDYAS